MCFTGFTIFADIRLTANGYRRLTYKGHKYGCRKINEGKEIITWECTCTYLDPITKRNKRCYTKVKTKIIDGYEMLQPITTYHDHPPPKLNEKITKKR